MNPANEHPESTAVEAAAAAAAEVSAEVLSTLAEIGEEVNSSLDLDEVLARTAALIKRHIDYEIFGVLMIEGDGAYLKHRFSIGYPRELADNCAFRSGKELRVQRPLQDIRCASATCPRIRVTSTPSKACGRS